VFNWTGIFDEMHDFERNTRGVSGGKGAVTKPDPAIAGATCGNLAQEVQAAISADGLGRAVKLDQDVVGNCTHDWDKVEAFGKTVRPPRRCASRTRPRSRAARRCSGWPPRPPTTPAA
jgi:hypothetical protein